MGEMMAMLSRSINQQQGRAEHLKKEPESMEVL